MVFWSLLYVERRWVRSLVVKEAGVPQALAYIHLQLLTMRNSQASHTISIMESESAGI